MNPLPSRRPAVLPWYWAYSALLALTYLGCVVLGIVFIVIRERIADSETPPEMVAIIGLMFVVLGLPFAAAFGAAPFLPPRPWTWIYHLVLICVGMTSACCLPASVALLVFWLKPETRSYFGRT